MGLNTNPTELIPKERPKNSRTHNRRVSPRLNSTAVGVFLLYACMSLVLFHVESPAAYSFAYWEFHLRLSSLFLCSSSSASGIG